MNGNFLSSSNVMTGASSTLRALETSFGQDFNSSGLIGTTDVSDQDDEVITFGGMQANGTLADDGANASLGRAIRIGDTPASDLALLTSHMASSFAMPAGGGAGVAAAQTSDHDFLTKPAA